MKYVGIQLVRDPVYLFRDDDISRETFNKVFWRMQIRIQFLNPFHSGHQLLWSGQLLWAGQF